MARKSSGVFALFATCAAFILLSSQVPAQDLGARDAAGLADAYRSQVTALRRGDVLIQVHKFQDPSFVDPADEMTDVTVLHRWIFDHDAGRYFYFQSGEQTVSTWGGDLATKRRVTAFQGFVINEFGAAGRMMPNAPVQVSSDLMALMRRYEVPDLTTLGFASFGASAPQDHDFGMIVEAFTTAGAARSSRSSGPEEQILTFTGGLGQGHRLESVWHFDLRQMVPSRVAMYTIQEGLEGRVRRGLNYQEMFTWEERNGAVIPMAINVDRPRMQRVANQEGQLKTSLSYISAKLHWFAVNEELDAQFFDQSIIADVQRLSRSVNPEATGASSLLKAADQAP